jgi:hypothetical protein
MIDAIVEEFRAVRQQHASLYNNDLDAICTALRAEEAVSDTKYVRGKRNPGHIEEEALPSQSGDFEFDQR